VTIKSFRQDSHNHDVKLLKCAEQITDAVYAAPAGGSRYPFSLNTPKSGYAVSLPNHEVRFCGLSGKYGEVYAVVLKLLRTILSMNANRTYCVGWWGRDGVTYFDISYVFPSRLDAEICAEFAGQIAIYDFANQCDLDIRYS